MIDLSERYSTIQEFEKLIVISMCAQVASAAHLNTLLKAAVSNLWGFGDILGGNLNVLFRELLNKALLPHSLISCLQFASRYPFGKHLMKM